ncbi:MAG: sulfatase-like hydrolase/transferase, partial [Planctomycetales bacterium]
QRQAGDTSRLAIDWLEDQGDQPFFLFLHYFDPHAEYAPPEPYATQFKDNLYAGEIAYTDHCIGQVIDKLKSMDLYDSTLLIVTSDHGEGLGEHKEETHAYYIYQSTIHVPLIIKAPGCSAGSKRARPVGIVDVVPTVLGSTGITPPPHLQGQDLSALLAAAPLDEKGESARQALYCESLQPTVYGGNGLFGLINNRWKYIWTTNPELYDLVADPNETNNLIDKETTIAAKMQEQLQGMKKAETELAMHQLDTEGVKRIKSLGYLDAGIPVTAVEVDPKRENPKELLDHHNRLIKSMKYASNGNLTEARQACLEILKLRPRDPQTLKHLGDLAAEEKRHADAISRYSQYLSAISELNESATQQSILSTSAENASVYNNLGLAFQGLGQSEQAIAHFQRALEINP